MKVKDIMTTEIISVDKDQDVKLVLKLMKKHGITKIPVLEEKKLIGVVTDEMLAVKLGAIRTRGIPAARMHVSSVMDKELDIISQDDDVSAILTRVGEPGPTILVVVENEHLIGIVTKADLLHLVNSENPIDEVMEEVLRTVSPEDRERKDFTTAKVFIDACWPYHLMDTIPRAIRASDEIRNEVMTKWKELFENS